MKKAWILVAVLALLTITPAGFAEKEAGRQTFSGKYNWQGTIGDLEASFKPRKKKGKYEVTFTARFRNQLTFRGSAEGSLTEGKLRGTVWGPDREQTYAFEGRFEDGTFTGEHFEISDGGSKEQTGTLHFS